MRGHLMKQLGRALAGSVLVSAVAFAGIGQPPDAGLQSLARYKLSAAKLGEAVQVVVENGIAVLQGTVDAVGRRDLAEREVASIKGILKVSNNIRVAGPEVSDAVLLEEAVRKIRGYPFYTIFENVEASLAAGRLTLTGQVTKPWYREDYGRLVSMIPGVVAVDNVLEVLPLSPMDDEIRIRVARAIYREPALLRYGARAYPPIHIVVRNGNVTLTGVVLTEVEKAVAGNAARFAGLYFALDNRLVVETEAARSRS